MRIIERGFGPAFTLLCVCFLGTQSYRRLSLAWCTLSFTAIASFLLPDDMLRLFKPGANLSLYFPEVCATFISTNPERGLDVSSPRGLVLKMGVNCPFKFAVSIA
jgi:hypothetical protein